MTAVVLIWGPLYLLATIIVTLVVFWLSRKFTGRWWPSLIVPGLAIAWPVGDIALTKRVLQEHCADRSGVHIYRTVEDVVGYFSTENGCGGSCQEALIHNKYGFYRFVEARVGRVTRYDFPLSPGLYRFTVEKPGHPQCKVYDEWLSKLKGLQRNKDYQNNCIATWEIDEISSRYRKEYFENITKTFIGDIRKSGYLFRDSKTNEILADSIGFVLNSSLFWSYFMNPHVCRIGGGGLMAYDVLKPLRDGR